MNPILERLIQDHKNMTCVHACLKREMTAFVDLEKRPNLLLLLDAMDYLRTYSDGFHHPLEDRLYARMRLRVEDPVVLEMLDQIELQHAWMHVLAKRLHDHLQAIANDQITPLARLLKDYQAYITMAEAHITNENQYLLPAIERDLAAQDFADVLAEIAAVQDPLRQDQQNKVFTRLYNAITAEQEAAA